MQVGGKVRHREACGTLCHSLEQTLFNGGVEVFGNNAADDRYGEGQPLSLAGREFDPDVAELTRTAVLLFMSAVDIDGLCDLLAICDLRRGKLDRNAVAVLQLCGKYRKVHIAETRNEHLLCVGIRLVFEREIFFDHSRHALGDLALVLCGLGDHCLSHVRDGINCGSVLFVAALAQGVVGVGVGELCDHTDITAGKLIRLCLCLALKGVDMSHFFDGAGIEVFQRHVPLQRAVHDLEVGHLADERVGDRLEYEHGGRSVGIYLRRGTVLKRCGTL